MRVCVVKDLVNGARLNEDSSEIQLLDTKLKSFV